MKAGIIRADRFLEQRIRLDLHLFADPLPPFFVHEIAVARRVDLNIFDVLADELCEIPRHDGDNVPQQRRMSVVNFICNAALIRDRGKLRRAR